MGKRKNEIELEWNFKNNYLIVLTNDNYFHQFSATVCRRWRQIAYDTKLWRNVSLRPEISGDDFENEPEQDVM